MELLLRRFCIDLRYKIDVGRRKSGTFSEKNTLILPFRRARVVANGRVCGHFGNPAISATLFHPPIGPWYNRLLKISGLNSRGERRLLDFSVYNCRGVLL